MFLDGLQSKRLNLDEIRSRFKKFDKIFYKLYQQDRQRIINILVKEIIVTIPKDSKKGTIKIRAWNLPSKDFVYDVKSGLRFEATCSGGETRQ